MAISYSREQRDKAKETGRQCLTMAFSTEKVTVQFQGPQPLERHMELSALFIKWRDEDIAKAPPVKRQKLKRPLTVEEIEAQNAG